jgi:small GTP-binding protein
VIDPSHDEARRRLLEEARSLTAEVDGWVARLGVDPALSRALAASRAQLDGTFLLVLVGEFNSGKSTFINALLGRGVLAEGVTPTTTRIALLEYGEPPARRIRPDGVEVVAEPAEVLREVAIVDTPGTNAVLREHETLTREFVPRADLVLFLTSADRPYTETERAFLEALREWGKKVVVVVNKGDLLETGDEVERVLAFVREQAARTLGAPPEVFALSARGAVRARERGDTASLEASGLPAFERSVTARLSDVERFRLKLMNPAGVARRAIAQLGYAVRGRQSLVDGDVATLREIDSRLVAHAGRIDQDFHLRLSDVEKVLLDFEKRGNDFFDARLRLGRFRELFDRERLRRDFEASVIGELPREVERRVEAVVDWMVGEDLALWQEVMRLLRERQSAHAERLAGTVDDRFAYDRQARLVALWQGAQSAVETYDPASEAKRLAEKVRESVAGVAVLQVSALGLGAMVALLASTTAADVTGFLTAGVLSVVGLLVLPARREKARRELAAKVHALRAKLAAALVTSFDRERERSLAQVRESIAPYATFVSGERRRLDEARTALARLADSLDDLAQRAAAFGR